ncbi:uncharacterized protein LOC126992665 [Eriocheir sinensis]|uniref:uncharacterized protein LOC126992665 n=1 Tax=Eriocheir sinensis TaxID=95602 RepID=UPI0021C82FF0|nr:uncharacterized protein LOC126992665 [Eriocheir sinensis]
MFGVEESCSLVDLYLDSNCFTGLATVAAVKHLPVREADFVLGNDLAGSRVEIESPASVSCERPEAPPTTPDLGAKTPKVPPRSAVTPFAAAEKRDAEETATPEPDHFCQGDVNICGIFTPPVCSNVSQFTTSSTPVGSSGGADVQGEDETVLYLQGQEEVQQSDDGPLKSEAPLRRRLLPASRPDTQLAAHAQDKCRQAGVHSAPAPDFSFVFGLPRHAQAGGTSCFVESGSFTGNVSSFSQSQGAAELPLNSNFPDSLCNFLPHFSFSLCDLPSESSSYAYEHIFVQVNGSLSLASVSKSLLNFSEEPVICQSVEVGGKAQVSCRLTSHPFSFKFHGPLSFSESGSGTTCVLAIPEGRRKRTGSHVSFLEEHVGVTPPEDPQAPGSLAGQSSVGVEEEVNVGLFTSGEARLAQHVASTPRVDRVGRPLADRRAYQVPLIALVLFRGRRDHRDPISPDMDARDAPPLCQAILKLRPRHVLAVRKEVESLLRPGLRVRGTSGGVHSSFCIQGRGPGPPLHFVYVSLTAKGAYLTSQD